MPSRNSNAPSRCPLCSANTPVEIFKSGNDAACPGCGAPVLRAAALLSRLQELARKHPGLELEEITASSSWPLGGDSLTAVEVMLELERELGISVTAREAERMVTVGQAIRYFSDRIGER